MKFSASILSPDNRITVCFFLGGGRKVREFWVVLCVGSLKVCVTNLVDSVLEQVKNNIYTLNAHICIKMGLILKIFHIF